MEKINRGCIVIFTKYPKKNRVKTRLAKEIGPAAATALHKYFVEQTLATVKKSGLDIFVNIKPAHRLDKFKQWLGHDINYLKQKGLELGGELAAAFNAMFEKGYKKIIAIGTDTPDLPVKFINEACRRLSKYDAVLGPAKDGGYYLIGLKKKSLCSKLFDNIAWSTSEVFAGTLEKLKKAHASYKILPEWQDIDTIEDLKCYYSRARNHRLRL